MFRRISTATAVVLVLAGLCAAQSVQISPSELSLLPRVSGQAYWQQLVITFDQADAASDSAVAIELPASLSVRDVNGDGSVQDDVRLMYRAAADETPGFFASTGSTSDRIIVGSSGEAAREGRLYVQFPIVIFDPEPGSDTRYGPVSFADPRERDLNGGPFLTVLSDEQFGLLGSMDIVKLGPLFAATGADTATSELGSVFPDTDAIVVATLPDLVFDGGGFSASDLLGFGNGDDGDDTEYGFHFSTDGRLASVDETVATPARVATGELYLETESGGEREVRFLTQALDAGTYYLYVTSNVTGAIPLARSRAIAVRHQPRVLTADPAVASTMDSGDLYDVTGLPVGNSVREVELSFAALDHDDPVSVHLLYSSQGDLTSGDASVEGEGGVQLAGATRITPASGILAPQGSLVWNILEPTQVPAGDYWIYTVAVGGAEVDLKRSDSQIHVRHAPSLRLDALDDAVLSGTNSIVTGGERPQSFVTLTWGRGGRDGDGDIDGDAVVSLYYSTRPAASSVPENGSQALVVPAGAPTLLADVGLETRLIADGLREDPDRRVDNQYVWDLTSHSGSTGVPEAGRTYYIYGIITDGEDRRLAQMNGGRLNDAASRIVFAHPPTLRPVQPVDDISVPAGRTGRVSWQDADLDSKARIRIILTAQDHGSVSDYSTVTAASAYVANSPDGRAAAAVDPEFDLDEDDDGDFFDVAPAALRRGLNTDEPPPPGPYYVYLAITEADRFGTASLAWRAAGRIEIAPAPVAETGDAPVFNLRPESFTLGTRGSQRMVVQVDDGDRPVDLVVAHLRLDGNSFAVADADTSAAGIQPFTVAPGFSAAKLVKNALTSGEAGELYLSFEYFEATASRIEGLDGETPLASFELIALENVGDAEVELVADPLVDRLSRLDRDGVTELEDTNRSLATARVVAGRALVRGVLRLEGRTTMIDSVDFSLRPWASYRVVDDSLFAAANDADSLRDGVQVQIDPEGAFELTEVPTGRLDLHVHLDGYLDAWHAGLDLLPASIVEGIRPVTPGARDSLMLGGDVAGYAEVDGRTLPDNEVTLADWDFVAALFDRSAASLEDSARADITADGIVNIRDLALVGANFLRQGPRPVYKPVVADEPALRQGRIQHVPAAEGRSAIELWIDSPADVAAYQLELVYAPDAWALLEAVPGKARALAVQKQDADGHKVAAVLLDGGLMDSRPIMTWHVQALRPDASPPVVRQVLLLDRTHRELTVDTGIAGVAAPPLPFRFALDQNYPNPFNPETTIAFTVPSQSAAGRSSTAIPVRLEVYNSVGQRVAVLLEQPLAAGQHRVRWDGNDHRGTAVGSGVYFYRLDIDAGGDDHAHVRRMLLLR